MKPTLLLFIIALTVTLGLAASSQAMGLQNLAVFKTPAILLPIATTKCVRLLRRGNQETLVNTCDTCMIVGVTRKRTGIAVPVRRSFNLRSGASFAMPFRGPGASRITSSQTCQDEVADARDSDKKKTANNQCLELKPGNNGTAIIVNGCGACRAAAIQRMSTTGRILERQAYKLKPNATEIVISKGAAKVRLIADIACPV